MIWLASFPRSGSTFLRIVLDQVYGIESSTFHREETYPVDANYTRFPVVKTHLLPGQLAPSDPSIPAVYLVRDGRDCVVSLAHYQQQLIAPESDQRNAWDSPSGEDVERVPPSGGCEAGHTRPRRGFDRRKLIRNRVLSRLSPWRWSPCRTRSRS